MTMTRRAKCDYDQVSYGVWIGNHDRQELPYMDMHGDKQLMSVAAMAMIWQL